MTSSSEDIDDNGRCEPKLTFIALFRKALGTIDSIYYNDLKHTYAVYFLSNSIK